MSSATVRDFLEGSTIHGLVHISAAKSTKERLAWVAIVVVCFAIAISMITSSYKEWQESPVSTTITTHPITELEFPSRYPSFTVEYCAVTSVNWRNKINLLVFHKAGPIDHGKFNITL